MRAVKRWLRNRRAEYLIAPRARAVAGELEAVLGRGIRLVSTGAAGRDSIYTIDQQGVRVAVMRLVNPFKRRPPPPANSPFVWLDDQARLDREWQAYTLGAPVGLTPQPLWRTDDALVCKYIPYRSLSDRFRERPGAYWEFLLVATRAVARLHELSCVHMDASLNNILADDVLGQAICIDFEYAPAPFLSEAQQRAYDFLRLLESSIKFCGEELLRGTAPWLELLEAVADDELRQAELTVLHPGLGRLLGDTRLSTAVRSVFQGL